MIIAQVGDIPYNITLLLHVLTALMAFSPMFVYPLLPGQMRPIILPEQQRLVVTMLVNMRSLYGPALILTGLLGFALSGMSEGVHSMRDSWIITAGVVWVLMNGVLHAMILPAVKTMGTQYLNRREAESVVESAIKHMDDNTLEQLDTSDAPHLIASATEHAIAAAAEHTDAPASEHSLYQHTAPGHASTADEDTRQAQAQEDAPQEDASEAEHGHEHMDAVAAEHVDTAAAEHVDTAAAEHMVAYTTKRLQQGSGIMTFLLIVELWLMIWQPELFQL